MCHLEKVRILFFCSFVAKRSYNCPINQKERVQRREKAHYKGSDRGLQALKFGITFLCMCFDMLLPFREWGIISIVLKKPICLWAMVLKLQLTAGAENRKSCSTFFEHVYLFVWLEM